MTKILWSKKMSRVSEKEKLKMLEIFSMIFSWTGIALTFLTFLNMFLIITFKTASMLLGYIYFFLLMLSFWSCSECIVCFNIIYRYRRNKDWKPDIIKTIEDSESD